MNTQEKHSPLNEMSIAQLMLDGIVEDIKLYESVRFLQKKEEIIQRIDTVKRILALYNA